MRLFVKRVHRDEAVIAELEREVSAFLAELDAKIATTPRLLPELVKRFRAAAPVIAMLNAPLRGSARATSLT